MFSPCTCGVSLGAPGFVWIGNLDGWMKFSEFHRPSFGAYDSPDAC